MHSTFQQRGKAPFPSFLGERIYMVPFFKSAGLPESLARWQPTVDAMLDGIDAPGPVYLMVDQASVRAESTHRRPGLHVDGYWHPAISCHGGGGGGHGYTPPAHRGTPSGSHGGWPATHGGTPSRHGGHSRHCLSGSAAEALLIASDVLGCVGYEGRYESKPGDGGDCEHISREGLMRVPFEPGSVFAGHTLTMLHESIPVPRDCLRTVVRLNVPGWAP
jgi:hypothetical protein